MTMNNQDKTKEYAFRVVAVDNVQTYLNEQAQQNYVLMNIQPFARKIKDSQEGTSEEVQTFAITMERPRLFTVTTQEIGTSSVSMPATPEIVPMANPS